MTTIKGLLDDYGLQFSERMHLMDNLTKKYVEKSDQLFLEDLFTNKQYQREMALSGLNPFPSYHFEPYYISGQVFMSSVLDSLLCQMYYHPYILSIVYMLVGIADGQASSETQVFQLPMPAGFEVNNIPYQFFNFFFFSINVPYSTYMMSSPLFFHRVKPIATFFPI